jgi:hypothetical protein
MLQLITSQEQFDQRQLEAWRKGHREDIIRLAGSDHLRGVLQLKSSSRKKLTARFFGESYVASCNPRCSGFYGSFKWLTNARFGGTADFPKGPARPFQQALREALHKHFTAAGVVEVQRAAERVHRGEVATLQGKKPTAPDLWLIDEHEHHRFIEAKLPGDSLSPHQVAGLAILAACLGHRHSVSVEVVELRPRYEELFDRFGRSATAG